MNIIQALILGLVQGATEFIPISSSGHLTLIPWLFHWTFDPVLKNAFDVMAHWGTLAAVLAVFWQDLWALLLGWLRTLGLGGANPSGAEIEDVGGLAVATPSGAGSADAGDLGVANPSEASSPLEARASGFLVRVAADADGRMAWLIAIGSLPAALAGLLFENFFEMLFGTPRLVSILLLVTAGLLAVSEGGFASPRRGRQERDLSSLKWFDVLFIGLGQALAIAPGISRSGATIAAGLVRGVRRDAAARFSFLLSTPVILGAGVWQLKDLVATSEWTAALGALIVGFVGAALAGYLCIRFLLRYLRRGKLYPFALYCALAGTFCLVLSFVR
jgi:undecaprenyl-diphosphatase